MKKKKPNKMSLMFDRFSGRITKATGSPSAFFIALLTILIWGMSGPVFRFSDTWQLVINTGTTIITFLMVFIIQQSQNKDTVAIHLKLNEIIAATRGASNRMIDVEDLTADELEVVKQFYIRLSDMAEKEKGLSKTHTFDEAAENHRIKMNAKKK
jgi:low affinity Fe/Cu permease